MFTMLNVVYDYFLTRKPPFYTLFILSRTSDNTASQNIGGDQCMGRPPASNFLGGPSPQSSLGLRPWSYSFTTQTYSLLSSTKTFKEKSFNLSVLETRVV